MLQSAQKECDSREEEKKNETRMKIRDSIIFPLAISNCKTSWFDISCRIAVIRMECIVITNSVENWMKCCSNAPESKRELLSFISSGKLSTEFGLAVPTHSFVSRKTNTSLCAGLSSFRWHKCSYGKSHMMRKIQRRHECTNGRNGQKIFLCVFFGKNVYDQ